MQLVLFSLLLIFHLLFCKYYLKNFTLPFSIYGIIWFSVLIFTKLPIIEFKDFNTLTLLIFIIAYCVFLFPHLFVKNNRLVEFYKTIENDYDFSKIKKAYNIIFVISLFFYLIYYLILIIHYGGLIYIFRNAFNVRHDFIQNDIVPIYISYGLGLVYVAAGLGSLLLFFSDAPLKIKPYYLMPLLIVFFADLLTSSRMSFIFLMFIYLSAALLKYSCLERQKKKKMIIFFIILFPTILVALFIPKFLRDLSVAYSIEDSSSPYLVHPEILKIPLVGQFMHFFMYITGPIAAFDSYIVNFSGHFTYGEAQLLPLFHFVNKVFPIGTNYSLLYDFVDIPFPTNIYTYLREAYSDFGTLGIIMTPLFLGLLSCCIYNSRQSNRIVYFSIYQFLFLFSAFSIFYNPFSQGGVTIGFAIYIIIASSIRLKKKKSKMVSYVMVSYNTCSLTIQSVQSILDHCTDCEVIVVDNGSKDETVPKIKEIFKRELINGKVVLLDTKVNNGFSKGNNLGVSVAKGNYYIFINPDTVVCSDLSSELVEPLVNKYCENDVIISPKILNPDLTTQHSVNCFPIVGINLFIKHICLKILRRNKYVSADWLTGVCYCMSKETFDKLRGWNEKFELYSEDLDICYRVRTRLHGLVVIKNGVSLIHYGNQSGKQVYDTNYKSLEKKLNALKIFYNMYFNDEKFKKWLNFLYYFNKTPELKEYIDKHCGDNQ